jgi:hypothetical protein
MTLPLLGTAVTLDTHGPIRDWVCGPGRALEIWDFCRIGVLERDHADLIAAWQQALDGHSGPRWIHGPFFGLDIATPDSEVRAVMQKRVLQRLAVAEALGADLMVIHSPFTHWHQLNRANYPDVHPGLIDAAAACLAPVLARAADTGCTLMLENCDDTDPFARVEMARRIGHPKLRCRSTRGMPTSATVAMTRRMWWIMSPPPPANWPMSICRMSTATPTATGTPATAASPGARCSRRWPPWPNARA